MATFQIFRQTTVPSTFEASAIYLVAPPANPTAVEFYVSNAAGDALKRIPTIADIQTLINDSIAGLGGDGTVIVADIAARDALSPTVNTQVLVLDASDDATVTSGAATYIYQVSTTTWIKISEAESLDLILEWANIVGRPSSSPAAIDTAVSNSHTHANKTQLDKIDEDIDGNFTYDGDLPKIAWDSTGW
jgi:hypothetical protein